MSAIQEDYDVRVEIQKLLVQINDDMIKLKNELSTVHTLVEESAPLPMTAKLVNEKLLIAAKEAGIDLEDLDSIMDSESDGTQPNGDVEESNDDDTVPSAMNAESIATSTEQLTERMKHVLK